MHEIKQINTVTRTIGSVFRTKAFRFGYEQAGRGIPLDPDLYSDNSNDRWHYERGRQFAFLFDGRIKNGNRLNVHALHVFGNAVARGLII